MGEKNAGRILGFKAALVGVVVFCVVYLESRMRFTTALAGALLGLPALAEVVPRQSNTDQSQKWVILSCVILVGGTDEVLVGIFHRLGRPGFMQTIVQRL